MFHNTIISSGSFNGQVSAKKELIGKINSKTSLKGAINNSSQIKGIINPNTYLNGIIFSKENIEGKIDIPIQKGKEYKDKYIVTPRTTSQILKTEHCILEKNITVLEIPYFETSNETGDTVYIGGN